eukprot:CAMPEP_0185744458 /NCGR_PEP_ID=MMETSP1174-20130828/2587_1 /TAXON_ID=35687 /ORGANISM="Dictyocha speculum, Strain CCMP1381" /LENGTH=125 /DNA_ID=CAMNT_0028417877 /DNA_START=34 /DNA_END=411 /DNA_ORIENTATION=+
MMALRTTSVAMLRATKRPQNLFAARRSMGGHGHGPPPEDMSALGPLVRQYVKTDTHMVLFILGFYTSIYGIVKLMPGGKKAEVAAAVASSGGSSTIPSIIDESFEEWSKIPGNMAKWEASVDQMA